MPRVICTLPNASKHINGVDFSTTADGMAIVSDEISAEQAEIFLSIPGYEPEPVAKKAAPAVAKPAVVKAPATAAKAATKAKEPAPETTPEKAADTPEQEPAADAPADDATF